MLKLERIIYKALEKDRDLRYQHASEMRADLKRLKRETESGRVVTERPRRPATSAPRLPEPAASVSGSAIARSVGVWPLVRRSALWSTSSSSVLIAEARRHKGMLIGTAVVVLALVLAAAFGVYKLLGQNAPAIDTRNISIRPLTEHGQVIGIRHHLG